MREVELKLAVHGSFVMPSLVDEDLGIAVVEELPDLDMRTTYYDTQDLRMARNGITLRYRTGEDEGSRWTLKLPVPGEDGTAHEERHLSSSPSLVPEQARDLVAAYVRSASLSAVASVRTRRHRWSLRDGDGTELCEVVDDEVSVVEGSKIVSRFREMEVEARTFGPFGAAICCGCSHGCRGDGRRADPKGSTRVGSTCDGSSRCAGRTSSRSRRACGRGFQGGSYPRCPKAHRSRRAGAGRKRHRIRSPDASSDSPVAK